MKFIGWLFGVAVAIVLIVFAVSNGTSVTLRFEPLPYAIDLPLYAVTFIALVLGFVLGGIVAWFGGGKWRRRARRAEAESERLKRTAAGALDRPAGTSSGPVKALPTIPEPPRVD